MSLALILTFFVAFPTFSHASLTQPTTEPSEVRALNSIFDQWGIKADTRQWNISGEPCSGAAIGDSTSNDDSSNNAFIKCECSFKDGSLCHITKLHVYEKNVGGEIPEELWTLTFLSELNLARNLLTGSLSPSIGNLTDMQDLSIESNALSGEVPKELGRLTKLISLSFSSNNFSGTLPQELGNLNKLQTLSIDSSGVSGEIPSTFANLTSLQSVSASDNELTGKIPGFIGNWRNLITLALQGNSFEGPIPPTFVNLTSLTALWLSEISNASSSLAFIKNMKSLRFLILRNNNITDSIPSNIGDYQKLTKLDLSFNNISGQIPQSLFNMGSLLELFLGNNSLSGTLPQQKISTSLNTIDLSYNNLVGNLPTWVNQPNLQMNLVGGNNFNIKSLKKSALPSGLYCLQQKFPCNRGKGIYYNFGISCGGPEITPSNGILYERDNETLGPATYYVSSTERWAVSSVGSFGVNRKGSYTSESALFLTARLSASSLRYYGLGLENGAYTVELSFAETTFPSKSWKSIGRRVFDIYIQGKLVLKDFDMKKETVGGNGNSIKKNYTKVRVIENYLEIHLFWAGKGTCCIPSAGTYGPSISAISANPEFIPTVSNKPPTKKNKRTNLIAGASVGIGVSIFFSVFGILYFLKIKKKPQSDNDNDNDEELSGMGVKPFTFSYAELKMATNDFSSANKLGEGGFGVVYKGTLEDGRVVAIKQLSVTSHHGKSQFVAEIATISAVQHRHLVRLYGCCLEGDKRLLVYEYLENKSLDRALFDHSLKLDWSTRFNICLGVARGLSYLHEESHIRIVHRDIKASNILLDYNLNPKISDFGLAKFYDDRKTHISICVAGTL
ncbi:probable LRR receptor-like serine/threonine-protein kinase At1g56140 [Humulus lupulus]|uniref:probable LRR receptor-like serine/threonine-protein kinase At1g56140 n=1 Tax=Humulus lupulus TaxID=3486 RepID=UPI002B4139A1|nr:probable LRR receptor-like serine/threonine-protein kinase At1g56140 [Humulus lupulus]